MIQPCSDCDQPGWFLDPDRQLLVCKTHRPDNAIRTLPDYRCAPGRVLLIGINPATTSAEKGHYYRGRSGTALWHQLERVGLLEDAPYGTQDLTFTRSGHGLTDLAKVPTVRGQELPDSQLDLGIEPLKSKVRRWQPGLVLLRYQPPGQALLGDAFEPPLQTPPNERKVRAGRCSDFESVPTFLLSPPRCRAEIRERVEQDLRDLLAELAISPR